jgi:FkbM family methyltransferase
MLGLPALLKRAGRRTAQEEHFSLSYFGTRSRTANEAAIRRLCTNAYLGGDQSLVRVLGRYKMFVDTQDVDLSAHLLLDGFWEMWVTELLPSLIRPGMICVDVGAHVGYFTMLMADLTGRMGEVHAFEPNRRLRRMLDESVRINGFAARVRSYGDPVFDIGGLSADLIVPERQPSGAHLHVGDGAGEAQTGALRTCRLDEIAGLDRVDFIKIDAEASEEAIWRGMRGLLDAERPMTVLIEFTAIRYADPGRFLAAMTEEGFALHRIDPNEGLCRASSADILKEPAAYDQMLVLIR